MDYYIIFEMVCVFESQYVSERVGVFHHRIV